MASSASTKRALRTWVDPLDILPVYSAAAKAKRIEEFSDEVKKCITIVKTSIKHIQDCEGFPCTSCITRMGDITTVLNTSNIDQSAVADGLGIDTDYCKMFAYTWKKGDMLQKIEDADQQDAENVRMLTFYRELTYSTVRFVHRCDYLCSQMEEDGCLSLIVDWFLHLLESDTAINKWVDGMVLNTMLILINSCRNVPTLAPKHHRVVPALQKFCESETILTQIIATMTLAKLVKKEEADKLSTNVTCITRLLRLLKGCVSNSDHTAVFGCVIFAAVEVVQAVDEMAINDNNKRLIVEKGGIPFLAKLLIHDCSMGEKTSAANGIWRLAFLKENKEKLRKEQGIIHNLTENSLGENEKLRNACMGALFEIYESRLPEDLTHGKTHPRSPPGALSDSTKASGHIMLSYKRENPSKPVMREFKKQLRQRGYNVWFDEDQMMGDKIGAMAEAVENADMIIACITRGYQDSHECRTEASYAFECKKKIIPVKVSNDFKASGWLGFITAGKTYYIVQQAELVSEVLPIIIEREFAVQTELVQNSAPVIDDGTLCDLAEAIETEQHMKALGRVLGFSAAEINRYAATNQKGDRTTAKGTTFMLRDWMRVVGAHNQLQRLTEALKKAGLVMLADTHFMNADPNEALQEKLLVDIAEALTNDENVAELGRKLGFSTAALNRYTETNRRGDRVTFKGTRDMLLDWRQKFSPSDQHQKLKEALTEANLVELSDNFLKEVPRPRACKKKVGDGKSP